MDGRTKRTEPRALYEDCTLVLLYMHTLHASMNRITECMHRNIHCANHERRETHDMTWDRRRSTNQTCGIANKILNLNTPALCNTLHHPSVIATLPLNAHRRLVRA